ncbi:MAG: hypothetical protein AAGF94_11145 [Pseudomonadota bacterium]
MVAYFETIMWICFSAAWWVSLPKLLKSKRARGKSLAFLLASILGCLAGMAAKWQALGTEAISSPVFWLLTSNMIFASWEVVLIWRFHGQNRFAKMFTRSSDEEQRAPFYR